MTLSPDLIARLRNRIADPARRNDVSTSLQGAQPMPLDDIQRKFDEIGTGDGFAAMREQMERWGFAPDMMNFKDMGGGQMRAFSEDPNAPLDPPPGDSRLDEAEATMRLEMPEEVRQLYHLADGGFGPGLGLPTLQGLVAGYQDVCRRGPDWTGEIEWPRNLLPIFSAVMIPSPIHPFETAQNVSIDTSDGSLRTFNEDWDQDDLTPETAWWDVAPSLEQFLDDWLRKG